MHSITWVLRDSGTSIFKVVKKCLTLCYCFAIIPHPNMAEIAGGSRLICCMGLLLLKYQVFIKSFHCNKLLFNIFVKNHSEYVSWKLDHITDSLW